MPGLNLSRAEAKERADHLYVNSYVVTLDVTKGEETFYSKSRFHSHVTSLAMQPLLMLLVAQ